MFLSLNTLQRTGNIAGEGMSEQIQIIRLVLRNYFKILPLNDLFNGSLGAHVGDRTNWLRSQTRGRCEHWLHWSWHTLSLSLDLSQSFSVFLSLSQSFSPLQYITVGAVSTSLWSETLSRVCLNTVLLIISYNSSIFYNRKLNWTFLLNTTFLLLNIRL